MVYPLIPALPFNYFATPLLILRISKLIKDFHPDLLISDGDFNLPIMSFCIRRWLRIPNIWMFRERTLEHFYSYHRNPLLRAVGYSLYKVNHFLFNRSKHLMAIDKKLQAFYQTALKRNDVKVINLLCVDMTKFKIDKETAQFYRQKFGIEEKEVIILYSGSVEPPRRLDLLIDSFFQLKKEISYLRLVISSATPKLVRSSAGVKNPKQDLIKKVRNLGLSDSVVFPNRLPWEEMPKLISMANICVDTYPKQGMTPSGKLLEWMACGKCVVCPDNPGDYLIKDGFNGILYSPGNKDELLRKIRLLLEKRKLREFLGRNARATVESDYDVRNVVPIFEQFCQEVISEHKRKETACHGQKRN
jgi:glycosyltransferase involved in cell wall biosynthesis